MKVQVVIPSQGRYQCAVTTRLFVDPFLCVGEDEANRYREANPGVKILQHSADLLGMGKKRQWILDNVDSEIIFMCDDDVTGLWCIVGSRARPIEGPDAIMAILKNSAIIAKGLGTSLFGFGHTVDTRHFQSFRPFTFSGYINGFAFGVVGRDIRFDPKLDTKQDIDFSLQVLLKKRVLWKDNRFAFKNSGWFRRTGGMADIRTAASDEKNIEYLKKKWGDAVEIQHYKRRGTGKHQNVSIHVPR